MRRELEEQIKRSKPRTMKGLVAKIRGIRLAEFGEADMAEIPLGHERDIKRIAAAG